MYKILILLAILIAGCSKPTGYNEPSSYYKADDKLVLCTSATGVPNKLLFYLSKQVSSKVPNAPDTKFNVFFITDVNGDTYSLNTDELINYTCTVVTEKSTNL